MTGFPMAINLCFQNHQRNQPVQQPFGPDGVIDSAVTGAGELQSRFPVILFAPFDLGDGLFDQVDRNHPVAAHGGQLEDFLRGQFFHLPEDPQGMLDCFHSEFRIFLS
jgi:hypothetical protein